MVWNARRASTSIFIGLVGMICCPLVAFGGSQITGGPNNDDIGSFIMRVGGWLMPVPITGDDNHYWSQVAYSVANKPVVGSAPLYQIMVTRSHLIKENHSTNVTCTQEVVVTETITLDPRDISGKVTIVPVPASATPDTIVPADPSLVGVRHPALWLAKFSTLSGTYAVVRVLSQTAIPTCPTTGGTWDANTTQLDSKGFVIEFADQGQATYLQNLVSATWSDATIWPPVTKQ